MPNAVKLFIWRACKNALPNLPNLNKRKVVKEDTYILCNKEFETVGHVLWCCMAAKDVWSQSCYKIQKMTLHSELFIEIYDQWLNKLNEDELTKAALIAKMI